MCGLFGVLSSSLTKSEIEYAQFLGILSITRGIDSTGVAVLGRGKKGKIKIATHRRLGNAASFLMSSETKHALTMDNPYLYMGHTRWATLGAVNQHNAHPIEENGIILCHNGSIDHFLKDRKDEKDSDSRELSRRLSRQPVESVLRQVGSGAYTISYINLNKGTVSFTRNLQRPLCFMYNKYKNTLWWASEMWMLYSLAAKEGEDKFSEPFMIAADTLYEFKLASPLCKTIKLDLWPRPDPKRSTIFDKKEEYGNALCRFCKKDPVACECNDNALDTSGTGPLKKETKFLPAPLATQLRPLGMQYKGYEGTLLPIQAMLPILKKGCASCQTPAGVMDKVQFFDDDAFVCEKCWDDDPTVKQYITKDSRVYESSLVKPH